jgi:beta-galactosidase/beta-glucuronidase
LDLTPYLKSGANDLTVRAGYFPTDRNIPRGKQAVTLESTGIFYSRTTGIWQPVWIEQVDQSYLRAVHVNSLPNGQITFEVSVLNPIPGSIFKALITQNGSGVAGNMRKVDATEMSLPVIVHEPKMWSPEDPQLYDCTYELWNGAKLLDRVHSYFGFRTIETRDQQIYFNGQRRKLKFLLDQGYWPETIMTPPSDEAIKRDINLTKQMGFNGVRKHQKVEDPRFLYWADHLGLMVSGEMANAIAFSGDYVQRFTNEWADAMRRDINHPSIVMWIPLNEDWGVPELARDPRQVDHLKSLYYLTHSLDNTRLVVDNDGWRHTDITDLFTVHDYVRAPELLSRWSGDWSKGTDVPNVDNPVLLPGYRYNGAPILLWEFGGVSLVPPGAPMPSGPAYFGLERDDASAMRRIEDLFAAVAKLPVFAGYCFTQLTDIEQERNGLLFYDRTAKFDSAAIRRMNDAIQ